MVNASKYGSKFISFDDVRDRPRRETIVSVDEGQFSKLVLTFRSGRQFSLNVTNVDAMIRSYGEETTKWIEIEIELFAGETTYQGKPQDSVLIRPISPPIAVDFDDADKIPF